MRDENFMDSEKIGCFVVKILSPGLQYFLGDVAFALFGSQFENLSLIFG